MSVPLFRPPPLSLSLSHRKRERWWFNPVLEPGTDAKNDDPESMQQFFGTILGLLKAAGQNYVFLKGHPDIKDDSDAECISKLPCVNAALLPSHLAPLIEEVSCNRKK
jgi:hypothetical protein